MTLIDFYILGQNSSSNRYNFACRLVEKIYKQGRRVFIHTASPDELRHMDRLLWTFRDGSFIPHGPREKANPTTPVIIGCDQDMVGEETDVLVNLAAEVPGFFSRFERVAEIIDQDAQHRASGRERFRYYRDRGYELTTHEDQK